MNTSNRTRVLWPCGGFSGTWFILLGAPGEHLVLEALGKRLSGRPRRGRRGFLRLDMEVSSLETRSLKAAFLQALKRLGVLVNYTPGAHQAEMAFWRG